MENKTNHDCCNHEYSHGTESIKKWYLFIAIGVILFIITFLFNNIPNNIRLIMYLISYIFIGYDIFINAIKRLFKKDMFDENFLMSVATIGAFCVGMYEEGIAVLLFYKVGEFLQEKAVERSKKKIEAVIDIRSDYANLVNENKIEKVNPQVVKIDDIILVKNGEKIPLDGIVIEGKTNIDMSCLTGESLPVNINVGDSILSGSINLGAVIRIKVTKTYENSTVSKIIDLIKDATSKKSKTEKFITKFAKIYTPIVVVLAIVIFLSLLFIFKIQLSDALIRALTFLVISCPCALVVSVPLGFFMGIGAASKQNILIKGSNFLDILASVDTFVFDKTGTLTNGDFQVTKINTTSKYSEQEIFEYIALAEIYSNHFIAKSIVKGYEKPLDKGRITKYEEVAGKGINAIIDDKKILVGNISLISDILINDEAIKETGTIIHISIDNEYAGNIVLSDTIKRNCSELLSKLKSCGISQNIMLTGDSSEVAEIVSNKIGIDKFYSKLLPNKKVEILQEIKDKMPENKYVAYVGDGINDGPVIAVADVGIAIGSGSDVAIETSDVVLMGDDILKLADCIKISRKTKYIIKQNIIFVLIVKVLFLVLSAIGYTSMWWAIFADVGVTLITILNSIRIFKTK